MRASWWGHGPEVEPVQPHHLQPRGGDGRHRIPLGVAAAGQPAPRPLQPVLPAGRPRVVGPDVLVGAQGCHRGAARDGSLPTLGPGRRPCTAPGWRPPCRSRRPRRAGPRRCRRPPGPVLAPNRRRRVPGGAGRVLAPPPGPRRPWPGSAGSSGRNPHRPRRCSRSGRRAACGDARPPRRPSGGGPARTSGRRGGGEPPQGCGPPGRAPPWPRTRRSRTPARSRPRRARRGGRSAGGSRWPGPRPAAAPWCGACRRRRRGCGRRAGRMGPWAGSGSGR